MGFNGVKCRKKNPKNLRLFVLAIGWAPLRAGTSSLFKCFVAAETTTTTLTMSLNGLSKMQESQNAVKVRN